MTRNIRLWIWIAVVSLLAVLAAAGCRNGQTALTPPQAGPATFVSNAACAECHPREFKDHIATNHAHTLRLAGGNGLGDLAPPAGPIPGTKYTIKREPDGITFARADSTAMKAKIDYAFGSGKTGMTYVALKPGGSALELRMICFPHSNFWYLTPCQEKMAEDELCAVHDPVVTQKCFLCHSVALGPSGDKPEPMMFGVGCESCHGPGSAHIAAARTKNSRDLKVEKMKTWDARRINEICGQCHRTVEGVQLGGVDAAMTQRFQAYGIMQSPCFQKSGEKLSCITCHDPHKNASKSQRDYEAACLKCHSRKPAEGPTISKVCPVNPTAKCIGCHMPPRKVFPFSKVPVYMADHLIWAYGRKQNRTARAE